MLIHRILYNTSFTDFILVIFTLLILSDTFPRRAFVFSTSPPSLFCVMGGKLLPVAYYFMLKEKKKKETILLSCRQHILTTRSF